MAEEENCGWDAHARIYASVNLNVIEEIEALATCDKKATEKLAGWSSAETIILDEKTKELAENNETIAADLARRTSPEVVEFDGEPFVLTTFEGLKRLVSTVNAECEKDPERALKIQKECALHLEAVRKLLGEVIPERYGETNSA